MSTNHAAAHQSPAQTGKKKKIPWTFISLAAGFVLLCVVVSMLNAGSHSSGRQIVRAQEASAERSEVQVPAAATQPVQPTAKCAPFTTTGADCDIDESGSGWIRPGADATTKVTYCWTPQFASGAFEKIEYLDESGETQTYDPDNPPKIANAYRFFPKHALTLSYSFAEKCRE